MLDLYVMRLEKRLKVLMWAPSLWKLDASYCSDNLSTLHFFKKNLLDLLPYGCDVVLNSAQELKHISLGVLRARLPPDPFSRLFSC